MNPLFAIRNRLREGGTATAGQLAAALNLPRASVEDMLAHWQRRGQVEVLMPETDKGCASACGGGGCGGCGAAAASAVQAYRWREAGA